MTGPDDASRDPESPNRRSAAARARRIGGRVSPSRTSPPSPTPTAVPGGAEVPPLDDPGQPRPRPRPVAAVAGPGEASAPAAAEPGYVAVPRWLMWAPAGALAVGAVVMAVLLVVYSHGVWWGPDPSARPGASAANKVREEMLAAAKSCVATTNTYKYTDLDTYESKALGCTTGTFTSELKQTITTLIKVNAPKLKATQTAQINRGGIESAADHGNQWTVLLFGQLSVVNSSYPKGRTDPFAAEVRMNKVHGHWLMSDLTTVSSPVSG